MSKDDIERRHRAVEERRAWQYTVTEDAEQAHRDRGELLAMLDNPQLIGGHARLAAADAVHAREWPKRAAIMERATGGAAEDPPTPETEDVQASSSLDAIDPASKAELQTLLAARAREIRRRAFERIIVDDDDEFEEPDDVSTVSAYREPDPSWKELRAALAQASLEASRVAAVARQWPAAIVHEKDGQVVDVFEPRVVHAGTGEIGYFSRATGKRLLVTVAACVPGGAAPRLTIDGDDVK